jgi:hypothetical protein
VFYFLNKRRIIRGDAGTIRAAVLVCLVAVRGPVGVVPGTLCSGLSRWISIREGGSNVTLGASLGVSLR